MKRWTLNALVAASVVLTPVLSSAQSWVPFGTGYWLAGAGQSGGSGFVTDSGTCAVGPACPYGYTYGGAELVGGPSDPAAITAVSFVYKPDKTGGSGGSPRLVMQFNDGGQASLRPLNWVAGVWAPVNGLATTPTEAWDNDVGGCGYLYNTTWTAIVACHPGAAITAIYIINDSFWLAGYDPEEVILDDVNVNGITLAPTAEACKKGGFAALGFRNQGQCVAFFTSKKP